MRPIVIETPMTVEDAQRVLESLLTSVRISDDSPGDGPKVHVRIQISEGVDVSMKPVDLTPGESWPLGHEWDGIERRAESALRETLNEVADAVEVKGGR